MKLDYLSNTAVDGCYHFPKVFGVHPSGESHSVEHIADKNR
jgi:hypothetical protein